MRFFDLKESKWWDDMPTILLYHGTSSALVPQIKKVGLQPPQTEIQTYARDILRHYIPEDHWTDELLAQLDQSISNRTAYHEKEKGRVLYFFTTPEDVEGYARSFCKHGGEIAYDVWQTMNVYLAPEDASWVDIKTKPIAPPRYESATPVVVEVEVPKEWCLWYVKPEQIKANLKRAWDSGDNRYARNFDSFEALLDDALQHKEIRIDRTIPPSMVRRFIPVSGK